MTLKSIDGSLLPHLLKVQFGSQIFQQTEDFPFVTVKGFAGSVPSLFSAEAFVTTKKSILFIADDKEYAHYVTSELEELVGEDSVYYFPETHLEPYQIEKTQNANIVLRTEVLNKLMSDKKPKIIVATATALCEKVMKKEDFKAISHQIKVENFLRVLQFPLFHLFGVQKGHVECDFARASSSIF